MGGRGEGGGVKGEGRGVRCTVRAAHSQVRGARVTGPVQGCQVCASQPGGHRAACEGASLIGLGCDPTPGSWAFLAPSYLTPSMG